MADVPKNQKLWAMIVVQARAKYHPYPSPGASHWVHKKYVEMGGEFIHTDENTRQADIHRRQFLKKRKELLAKRHAKKSNKEKSED
jgi:hypothetical protein